jgi:hypothetical protein
MLKLTVPGVEHYDEATEEFVDVGEVVLELEHSLVSLSKWESQYEKPFLGNSEKSTEEIRGYIEAMMVTSNPPADYFLRLSKENFEAINAYIEAKNTATWFHEAPGPPKSPQVITSELIYYWMTIFNIPFECETWHLNRLFTLIRICDLKNAKPKKMTRAQIAERNRRLNAERKEQWGTKG